MPVRAATHFAKLWLVVFLAFLPSAVFGDDARPAAGPVIVVDPRGPVSVWSQSDAKNIGLTELARKLANTRFVILGEVHDNADHHELRARLVGEIAKARRRAQPNAPPSAAVFEHATTDRQSAFDALNASLADPTSSAQDVSSEAFFKAAQWKKRGWPEPSLFRSMIEQVLKFRMPVYGGDVPRDKLKSIVGGSQTVEAEVFSKDAYARLKLDVPLDDLDNTAAMTMIAEAHCNVLPESILAPMAFGQRLRDAMFADTMISAADRHGAAILFTGNEHGRTDRGVPWYLRARGKRQIKFVAFREASADEGPKMGATTADYVVFTPSRKRPDPCESLRKKFGKPDR